MVLTKIRPNRFLFFFTPKGFCEKASLYFVMLNSREHNSGVNYCIFQLCKIRPNKHYTVARMF